MWIPVTNKRVISGTGPQPHLDFSSVQRLSTNVEAVSLITWKAVVFSLRNKNFSRKAILLIKVTGQHWQQVDKNYNNNNVMHFLIYRLSIFPQSIVGFKAARLMALWAYSPNGCTMVDICMGIMSHCRLKIRIHLFATIFHSTRPKIEVTSFEGQNRWANVRVPLSTGWSLKRENQEWDLSLKLIFKIPLILRFPFNILQIILRYSSVLQF